MRHLVHLSLCQWEAGKADDALKTLAKALEVTSKQKLAALQVSRVQHCRIATRLQAAAAGMQQPLRKHRGLLQHKNHVKTKVMQLGLIVSCR